jgi:hypothetical protein
VENGFIIIIIIIIIILLVLLHRNGPECIVPYIALCQHYTFWSASPVFISIHVFLKKNKMLDSRQTLAIVRDTSLQLSKITALTKSGYKTYKGLDAKKNRLTVSRKMRSNPSGALCAWCHI